MDLIEAVMGDRVGDVRPDAAAHAFEARRDHVVEQMRLLEPAPHDGDLAREHARAQIGDRADLREVEKPRLPPHPFSVAAGANAHDPLGPCWARPRPFANDVLAITPAILP